jgi:nitrate reductase gamma subunit
MFDLEFVRGTLHDTALVFMVVVYSIRLYWLLRFKAGKEIQDPTGRGDTSPRKGYIYSWGNIAMPWAMESTRTKFFLYLQFAIFHLGVTAAIILMFSISFYFKDTPLPPPLVLIFRIFIGAAFIVGVMRIIRRIGNMYVRAISSPDDHFAVWLLTTWFAFGYLAATNDASLGEWKLLTFFIMGSFFLIYVPFSKISHYLYYPFTRYYFGKTMGRRGVYPLRRASS